MLQRLLTPTNDGIGNNADTDDDVMVTADADDWAPLDSAEWWDTDGDVIGNNADSDDDADGTPDGDDTYPMDNDNDGWDDVYEDACGTDKTSATSIPSDNDADTVKLAHTGVQVLQQYQSTFVMQLIQMMITMVT